MTLRKGRASKYTEKEVNEALGLIAQGYNRGSVSEHTGISINILRSMINGTYKPRTGKDE